MTFTKLLCVLIFFIFFVSSTSSVHGFSNFMDTEAPTSPASLTVSNVTTNSIDLDWSASTDNIAVVAYNIYLDNVFFASTDEMTLSSSLTGLTQFTFYRFGVSSLDAAGNESDIKSSAFLTAPSCGLTTIG